MAGESDMPTEIQEIVALETAFMETVQQRDMANLERTPGRTYTLTTGRPEAPVRTREEWLEITRARYRIDSFAFDWLHVDRYSDAAVARSRYRQVGAMDGADRTQVYLMMDVWAMTDVWAREQGEWRLVSRHISPLA
jgi:hypothetical protein